MPRVSTVPAISFPYSMMGGDVVLHNGQATETLRKLPAKSVHCCITSPPYYKQRDYGVDGQIGLEKTVQEYVSSLVAVFQELKRVLRDDGTLWLNLGDKYEGDLLGVPWLVAFALKADGWILRQDVIWYKPSPMPEPVTNRCVRAHEYIFLLTKDSSGYYFDANVIREAHKEPERSGTKDNSGVGFRGGGLVGNERWEAPREYNELGRNKHSVWTVASQSLEADHFAAFPEKLIKPALLAGCPEKVCDVCGAPHYRQVESEQVKRERPNDFVKRNGEKGTGNACANSVAGVATRTIGWKPSCDCNAGVTGGTVIDPFVGSGTVPIVALLNGRKAIGNDLSAKYLRTIAVPRIESRCLRVPALANRVLATKARKPLGGGLRRR